MNNKEILRFAAQRTGDNPNGKKVVMIYAALSLGVSALVTLLTYVLGLQIDQYGGLSNLGTKTMLSTIQSMIPFASGVFTICLNLGFLAAAMRIARGQFVSPNTLRLGFDRFWVLMRCTLLRGMMVMAVMTLSVYLGIMLYMMTPLSDSAVEILMPYVSAMNSFDNTLVLDEAVYAQFALAVWPAYLFCAITCGVFGLPTLYSYRMAEFILIDKPGQGAMAALRQSKEMMRRNRLRLLRLDLRLWWWYLALGLATLVCYGDVILLLLGVELPGGGDLWYFVFLGLYLAVMFALYYLLYTRVQVSYSLAYDAIKPEEKQESGVVLGNIFQM